MDPICDMGKTTAGDLASMPSVSLEKVVVRGYTNLGRMEDLGWIQFLVRVAFQRALCGSRKQHVR